MENQRRAQAGIQTVAIAICSFVLLVGLTSVVTLLKIRVPFKVRADDLCDGEKSDRSDHQELNSLSWGDPVTIDFWSGKPRETIHNAVRIGDFGKVREFIGRHQEVVNQVEEQGRYPSVLFHEFTPLHCAIANRQLGIAKLLIEHGAHLEATDRYEYTPLLLASQIGHKPTMELLISAGANLTAESRDAENALHIAVLARQEEAARLLLRNGLTLDVFSAAGLGWDRSLAQLLRNRPQLIHERDRQSRTPLHYAVECGKCRAAELLLSLGADPNTGATYQWTPLDFAAYRGRIDIAKLLIANGANPNGVGQSSPLQTAVSYGQTEIVHLLLNHGADVSARRHIQALLEDAAVQEDAEIFKALFQYGGTLAQTTYDGGTLLHRAIEFDATDVAAFMLEQGIQVNVRRKDGKSELILAIERGNDRLARMLLAGGASVNLGDDYDETPLHFAARYGHREIASLLLKSGASIDSRSKSLGWTPLHLAAHSGHRDVAELLIENGADINSNESSTPLHVALKYDSLDVVNLLLDRDADVQARDNHGYTVLHGAAVAGNTEVAARLIERGAIVDAKEGGYGRTPLHWAAYMGKTEMVRFLLAKGADVNARENWRDETPLHLAVRDQHVEVVKLLLQNGADANARDKRGRTALDLARQRQSNQIVSLFSEGSR